MEVFHFSGKQTWPVSAPSLSLFFFKLWIHHWPVQSRYEIKWFFVFYEWELMRQFALVTSMAVEYAAMYVDPMGQRMKRLAYYYFELIFKFLNPLQRPEWKILLKYERLIHSPRYLNTIWILEFYHNILFFVFVLVFLIVFRTQTWAFPTKNNALWFSSHM